MSGGASAPEDTEHNDREAGRVVQFRTITTSTASDLSEW